MQLDIHLLQSGLHLLSLLVGALGLTAPKRCCNKSNVPSPNCTRVAGWRCFQGESLFNVYPGLKRPTSQSLRRGWLFGVTYRNTRGAIASATAAWAILLDRSAVRGKRPNSRRGRGRPRHNVGRATSPVRLPKTAWKLAKLQGGAASDAPPAHC